MSLSTYNASAQRLLKSPITRRQSSQSLVTVNSAFRAVQFERRLAHRAAGTACRGLADKVSPIHGSLVGQNLKFGIVVGRFNDLVTKLLLEGALEAFTRHGVSLEDITVTWVPGSFELPVVAKSMAKTGRFDAVLCIGTVVRGATTHYDAVAGAAASGILNASTDTGVPVIFGVLTCETMEQAMDRAGGKLGNKGGEAAVTAIEMANLLSQLRNDNLAAQPWGTSA